jgi:rhodanese-related sulfurtransferase
MGFCWQPQQIKRGDVSMKRLFVIMLVLFFGALGTGLAMAGDNPLEDNEKAVHKGFADAIPADKIINVDQFHKVWEEVLAGKRNAYLIDVRTHPEFYAFHIEGTDHIHAGHVYTIPKKIKDPNAEIYIWCRTSHRAKYVAGFLYKYGYKNVWVYGEGVVGWAKAGYPFVNQFTGKFKITEYYQNFDEMKDGKPIWRIREFHPY